MIYVTPPLGGGGVGGGARDVHNRRRDGVGGGGGRTARARATTKHPAIALKRQHQHCLFHNWYDTVPPYVSPAALSSANSVAALAKASVVVVPVHAARDAPAVGTPVLNAR